MRTETHFSKPARSSHSPESTKPVKPTWDEARQQYVYFPGNRDEVIAEYISQISNPDQQAYAQAYLNRLRFGKLQQPSVTAAAKKHVRKNIGAILRGEAR